MATDKLFTVAGISKLNGNYKIRFANDMMRIKVLAKSGHEDIRLMDLENAMTKLDAAKALLTSGDFADAVAQATITEYIEEKSPKQAKTAPAKAPVKAQPKAKAVKAPTADMDENIPF
jgi:multidrug resistance efflux pump